MSCFVLFSIYRLNSSGEVHNYSRDTMTRARSVISQGTGKELVLVINKPLLLRNPFDSPPWFPTSLYTRQDAKRKRTILDDDDDDDTDDENGKEGGQSSSSAVVTKKVPRAECGRGDEGIIPDNTASGGVSLDVLKKNLGASSALLSEGGEEAERWRLQSQEPSSTGSIHKPGTQSSQDSTLMLMHSRSQSQNSSSSGSGGVSGSVGYHGGLLTVPANLSMTTTTTTTTGSGIRKHQNPANNMSTANSNRDSNRDRGEGRAEEVWPQGGDGDAIRGIGTGSGGGVSSVLPGSLQERWLAEQQVRQAVSLFDCLDMHVSVSMCVCVVERARAYVGLSCEPYLFFLCTACSPPLSL